jgi:hypothetical protein
VIGDKGPLGGKGPVGDKGGIGDEGGQGDKGPVGDKGMKGKSTLCYPSVDKIMNKCAELFPLITKNILMIVML